MSARNFMLKPEPPLHVYVLAVWRLKAKDQGLE